MGRTTVLANIVSYLGQATQGGPHQIPFLGAVYGNIPKFISEETLFDGQVTGVGTGAFIWAWLGPSYETRRNVQGAPPGGKMRYYTLKLQCVVLSTHPESEDAQADNNTFLDALHDYIVASKIAGGGGAVWQWAEGTTFGGPDYHEDPGDPEVTDQGVTHMYTGVQIIVAEES